MSDLQPSPLPATIAGLLWPDERIMTRITLHFPDEKHARLKTLAAARGMSLNKLLDEAATVMPAEHDAQVRVPVRARRGNPRRGLDLLDKALRRDDGQ